MFTYKTSSYKTSIYQTSSYRMSRLQNVQVTKRPFYETSRLQNVQDTKCPVFLKFKNLFKKTFLTKQHGILTTLPTLPPPLPTQPICAEITTDANSTLQHWDHSYTASFDTVDFERRQMKQCWGQFQQSAFFRLNYFNGSGGGSVGSVVRIPCCGQYSVRAGRTICPQQYRQALPSSMESIMEGLIQYFNLLTTFETHF